MRLDKYKNPIYNSQDIFNLLYHGKGDYLSKIFVDADPEIKKFEHATLILLNDYPPEIWSVEKNDEHNQKNWFMPDEYKTLCVEQYILNLIDITDPIILSRVQDELNEYKNKNLFNLLRWLIYFVNICHENNIVHGVGRGSSVSSYVLYVIGVHYVDSIKYDLDFKDFLKIGRAHV